MSLFNNGYAKVQEECAELITAIAKKDACAPSATYWNGDNVFSRVEEEIGDVLAAIRYVIEENRLDMDAITARAEMKYQTFIRWRDEK